MKDTATVDGGNLNHARCLKGYNFQSSRGIGWCRISSINIVGGLAAFLPHPDEVQLVLRFKECEKVVTLNCVLSDSVLSSEG